MGRYFESNRFERTPEFMSAWERTEQDGMCRGKAPIWDSLEPANVEYALNHCAMCPVQGECLIVVRPNKSHFDGVAGGIVWREGKRVA